MYSFNPGLSEMLAKERMADLRSQGAGSRQSSPSFGRLRSLRKATGWALVEVGLHLAVPRRKVDAGRVGARQRATVRVAP